MLWVFALAKLPTLFDEHDYALPAAARVAAMVLEALLAIGTVLSWRYAVPGVIVFALGSIGYNMMNSVGNCGCLGRELAASQQVRITISSTLGVLALGVLHLHSRRAFTRSAND